MAKVKCDCLNMCGDDPWLAKGKSEPCEALKKAWAKAAEDAARPPQVTVDAQALHKLLEACADKNLYSFGVCLDECVEKLCVEFNAQLERVNKELEEKGKPT